MYQKKQVRELVGMRNGRVFCKECKKAVRYNVMRVPYAVRTETTRKTYLGYEARCAECGRPLDIPEVRDLNLQRRNKAMAG